MKLFNYHKIRDAIHGQFTINSPQKDFSPKIVWCCMRRTDNKMWSENWFHTARTAPATTKTRPRAHTRQFMSAYDFRQTIVDVVRTYSVRRLKIVVAFFLFFFLCWPLYCCACTGGDDYHMPCNTRCVLCGAFKMCNLMQTPNKPMRWIWIIKCTREIKT